MRKLGILFILIGFIVALFTGRSTWRDYQYFQASTVAAAAVDSVYIKPIRSGLSNIFYKLSFIRDGAPDTWDYKVTEQHTINDPLPSPEELKATAFSIRYVPLANKSQTDLADQVIIRKTSEMTDGFRWTSVFQPILIIALGLLLLFLTRKRTVN